MEQLHPDDAPLYRLLRQRCELTLEEQDEAIHILNDADALRERMPSERSLIAKIWSQLVKQPN